MAFDFPNAPTEGMTFAPAGGPEYIYKSGAWTIKAGIQEGVSYVQKGGDTMTGPLTLNTAVSSALKFTPASNQTWVSTTAVQVVFSKKHHAVAGQGYYWQRNNTGLEGGAAAVNDMWLTDSGLSVQGGIVAGGGISAASYTVLGQNAFFTSDAAQTFVSHNPNCFFQYTKATGDHRWHVNGNIVFSFNGGGTVLAAGEVAAGNDTSFKMFKAGPHPIFQWAANSYMIWNAENHDILCYSDGNVRYHFTNVNGYFYVPVTGLKPGGGAWADSSDQRIKNVGPVYTKGLDEVCSLNPITYSFKGNDTNQPPNNGAPSIIDPQSVEGRAVPTVPYPNSPHYDAAKTFKTFVGLIAQEVEPIFPSMVTKRNGYIDGAPVTDLRDLEVGELLFAVVNALKEIKTRLEALEA